jgi:hypothetical protein
MATRLVVTLGGGVQITGDSEVPLKELASLLVDSETEVRVISQMPAGYGVIWGEVVIVYVAMKALDMLTNKALDAFMDRIMTAAKTWAKQRVQERIARGDRNVRATHVEIRNEQGEQVGPSLSVEALSNRDVAVTVHPKPEYKFLRPVEFDPEWLEGRDGRGEEAGL